MSVIPSALSSVAHGLTWRGASPPETPSQAQGLTLGVHCAQWTRGVHKGVTTGQWSVVWRGVGLAERMGMTRGGSYL